MERGPLWEFDGDGKVELVGPFAGLKPGGRRLLAALLARQGRWVVCQDLAEDVWGNADIAWRTIHTAVHRLRKELSELGFPDWADAVESEPGSYRIDLKKIERVSVA